MSIPEHLRALLAPGNRCSWPAPLRPPACLRSLLRAFAPEMDAPQSSSDPYDPAQAADRREPAADRESAVADRSTVGSDAPLLADEATDRLRLVLESAPDAIVIVDTEGRIARVNDLAEELFGYAAEELVGRPVELLVPERYRARHAEHRRHYSADPYPRQVREKLELHGRRRDGSTFPVEISLSAVRTDRLLLVSSIRDVSEQRRAQDELRFLAEHDPLTGLRNRRRFQEDLTEHVGRARRYDEPTALLVIDVDDFKTINDTHGHGTGDEALRAIAAALRGRLRGTDVLARIGGDEFAVLLPHADQGSAAKTAADLRTVVAECLVQGAQGPAIRPGVSIGLAIIDADTESDDAALTEADRAMYRDKARRSSGGG